MFVWAKGEKLQLSAHFTTLEFTCQCKAKSCIEQKISMQLIDKLEKVRVALDSPIEITSGFRCKMHQIELVKTGYQACTRTSQHELGLAADIVNPNMKLLLSTVKPEFRAIGISKHFLHVDMRSDCIRYWYYKH